MFVKRCTAMLNKPGYVDMCRLDLSKTLMFDFDYNYIKNRHSITDTDSLLYEIERNDVYKSFWLNQNMFNFSKYP